MSADSAAVAPAQTSEKSIDPVCGMIVDPRHAKHHTDYRDQIYYFCCAGCLDKFSADPAKFLEPRAPAPAAAADAIYTCPMHPEIEQVGGRARARSAAWRWIPRTCWRGRRTIPNSST